MKKVLITFLIVMLTGCANIHMMVAQEEPVKLEPRKSLAETLPKLDGPPLTMAVYGFKDLTGQKKPNDKLALFSTAVTQGAEVFLIKALQDSNGWFKVVERVGLDNLVKDYNEINQDLINKIITMDLDKMIADITDEKSKLDKLTNDYYSAIISFDPPTIYLDNNI